MTEEELPDGLGCVEHASQRNLWDRKIPRVRTETIEYVEVTCLQQALANKVEITQNLPGVRFATAAMRT